MKQLLVWQRRAAYMNSPVLGNYLAYVNLVFANQLSRGILGTTEEVYGMIEWLIMYDVLIGWYQSGKHVSANFTLLGRHL